MKLIRFIGAASLASGMLLAVPGAAAADSVGLNTTGPDSNQQVNVDNSTTVTTTNNNNVQVENVNVQQAKTGNVTASDNTTVGGLASGNASNQSAANTQVTIENAAAVVPGQGAGGAGGGAQGGGGQVGGVQGGPGAGSTATAPGKGSVLGASTGGLGAGAAILPVTGATFPVDVSALRNAWHPQAGTSVDSQAKKGSAISAAMLLVAALLSLTGAAGSAVYARRQEMKA